MELRYMGFEQTPTRRLYQFDGATSMGSTTRFVVSADLDLFLRNRVSIQEGPSLCALKLKADLDAQLEGSTHELTNGDLAAYVAGRAAAAARKAEARKPGPRRRKPAPGQPVSPWWR